MVYTYTPAYYSSLHDTITSLCKTILPFSLKKRRLPALAAEQKLAKQQSENLKWQQESFHRILNLIGLHKEGILAENEVSAYRSHLLDTLIASPADQEQPVIVRDKLLFLQELFHAKCISADEYHASKRPLLQRLAVQGATIDCRDVIIVGSTTPEDEWSVIELKDEQCSTDKDTTPLKSNAKHRSPMKQIKGAVTMMGIPSPYKSGKNKGKKGLEPLCTIDLNRPSTTTSPFLSFKENPFWESLPKVNGDENASILMTESSPPASIKTEKERGMDKVKKKAFRSLFQKEQSEEPGEDLVPGTDEKVTKSAKKQWSFDGFKKWKKSSCEDELTMPYLPPGERSDDVPSSADCTLVASPIGEGPNTKLIKKTIHSDGSASDFFIDKVLGDNIKKELSRIQTELCTSNPNLSFSNEQIDAISTRLPVDKADLKKFFPKSWCDRYGDIVLDVVKKEFKDHVGEMDSLRNAAREKNNNSAGWVAFDDKNDENFHPNLFYHNNQCQSKQQAPFSNRKEDNFHSSNSECFVNNPFHNNSYENQNPFWNPRGSSMMG
ncbi:uncharacterized protein LOC131216902 [Magnolia sinica]|uniref:uncharacterized protein LOC131216902 n=1 Tax=Magnolia sinica TaxID=86752 RepID=UPI002658E911|nr:uncharacterized protein LOC131216902 [Magnolia sinica]